MQNLRQSLAMSPEAIEAFKKAERRRLRDMQRETLRATGADERMAKAEAKRQRRRERNLLHYS